MKVGWKVVIPSDGTNFGMSQHFNELRPVSPCCNEWLYDGKCTYCGTDYASHPRVSTWVINEHVTLWDDTSTPEMWISALTGIPKENIRVNVSDD